MDTAEFDHLEDLTSEEAVQFEQLCSSLPADIVRLIFEKALDFSPLPLQLLQVSCQVKCWLEPLVYRYVSLTTNERLEQFYRTFEEHQQSTTKDTSFFGRNVHSFFVNPDRDPTPQAQINAILKELVSIRSLACWDPYWGRSAWNMVLDSVATVNGEEIFPYQHLRRISIDATILTSRGLSFAHRAFRDITHMDVYFAPFFDWESLQALHHLTHLSLDMATDNLLPGPDELLFWFHRILDACPATVKVVMFGVVDNFNADFDLLDSEGDYLPPGWPPSDSALEIEGWTWLASESKWDAYVDLEILHPIAQLALGNIDPRAVAAAVTDRIPPHQMFRDLLVYFIYPDNTLDWDGMVSDYRDCWARAEDIIGKRRGLTYGQLVRELT